MLWILTSRQRGGERGRERGEMLIDRETDRQRYLVGLFMELSFRQPQKGHLGRRQRTEREREIEREGEDQDTQT